VCRRDGAAMAWLGPLDAHEVGASVILILHKLLLCQAAHGQYLLLKGTNLRHRRLVPAQGEATQVIG